MITTIGRRQLLENIQNKNQEHASKGKGLELTIDELIKGMKDLQLKFTNLEKGESLGVKKEPNEEEMKMFVHSYGSITVSTLKEYLRITMRC